MLDLVEPEPIELAAEYKGERVNLLVRPFALADIGWLIQRSGDGWFEKVSAGDVELSLTIINRLLCNRAELCEVFGVKDADLLNKLQRIVAMGEAQQSALLTVIMEAYTAAMPGVRTKKKRKRTIAITTAWLSVFTIGLIAGIALTKYYAGLLSGLSSIWN